MSNFYKCDKCGWIYNFLSYKEVENNENLGHYLTYFSCKSTTNNFKKIIENEVQRSSTIQTSTRLNADEVKQLREETQASLRAMDKLLLTITERYVIRFAREHDIDNEDVRGCLVELKKAQIIPGDEASKLYAICILERDWLDTK